MILIASSTPKTPSTTHTNPMKVSGIELHFSCNCPGRIRVGIVGNCLGANKSRTMRQKESTPSVINANKQTSSKKVIRQRTWFDAGSTNVSLTFVLFSIFPLSLDS